MKMLCAFVLVIASATAEAADTSAGSGIVIGTKGEILTNSHVVEHCAEITVHFPAQNTEMAALVARDEKNDLAVIRAIGANIPATSVAAFRDGAPVRAGDPVVALGYPLSGLLASTANLSVGNVSALAGLGDDSRYLQISAPVQPGNSGGPLLDAGGRLVGIVTAKLNAVRVAKYTGDIPQNVNFALKAEVARTFLDSKGIAYRKAPSDQQLSPADVGDIARPFTVHIECQQAAPRVAVAPTTSSPPPQARNGVTPQQLSWCKNDVSPDLRINGWCTAVKILSWGYNSRGFTYHANGDLGHAIAEYSEAIRINPNFALAYVNRGVAYRSKGDVNRAIADYSEAIRLDPNFALAYFNRGISYFTKQEFLPAAADLFQSIKLKDDAYPMLWRFLARGRHGESGAVELAANAERLKTKDWPYPVIEFYLGKRSSAEMLAATGKRDERCEAQFYLGEWHLLRSDPTAAAAALRNAAATCPKNFSEYDGAIFELKQLLQ